MKEQLNQLLEIATMAPSGDNCQPWRFSIENNTIDVFNDPSSDTSYYNFGQRASMIAHGALLENIALVAPTIGLKVGFKLFPTPDNHDHIAHIVFDKCSREKVDLEPFVVQRSTNRRRFHGELLNDTQLAALVPQCSDLDTVTVVLTNKVKKIRNLSKLIGLSDRLVFENKQLHNFLFDHIRWSDQEAEKFRDGLDIKTLELNKMDALVFKMLQHWKLNSFLGNFGVPAAIARNARKLASSASAIGLILGDDSQDLSTFIQGGRLFQRVWLQATKMGLSFHPMTGISFLIHRVVNNEAGGLAQKHIRLIQDALRLIVEDNNIDQNKKILCIFRVGYSGPPSARSLRKDLSEVIR